MVIFSVILAIYGNNAGRITGWVVIVSYDQGDILCDANHRLFSLFCEAYRAMILAC